MKDYYKWFEDTYSKEWFESGCVSLHGVAVQVVDWMSYTEDLTILVNEASPHANKFMKVRVGRLNKFEMELLKSAFNKYFPKTKPVFFERDGYYQTEFVMECYIDSALHFESIVPNKTWQYTTASVWFVCNGDYCNRWKKKHGLRHEYPTLTVFQYDDKPDNIPEPDWVWIDKD